MSRETDVQFLCCNVRDIICFLATTDFEDYSEGVSKEDRTLTINTLAKIEENMKNEYKKEFENNKLSKCLIGGNF